MLKTDKFILKWLLILFVVTLVLSGLIVENSINFIIGICLGTFLSVSKFLINIYNYSKILASTKTNNFFTVFLFVLTTVLYFAVIFIIFNSLKVIDIYLLIGVFIGVTYIPFIIALTGILQSLYIVRDKI